MDTNLPDSSNAGRAGTIMEEQGAIEVIDKEFEKVEAWSKSIYKERFWNVLS